jgi:short-subunit dehydrogenase
MKNYALITGSSKGIGRSIAYNMAKRGYDLILIARSTLDLEELKESLSTQFKVKVEILVKDLSEPGAALYVADWCKSNSFKVSVLINNAGFGLWGRFEVLSLQEQLSMLQLNMIFLSELTYYMLPVIKENTPGYILNISSTAAYQAMPTLALYAASKSFVLSFSRALRYEMKDSGVSVTCVCPGPADTGFAERAGLLAFKDMAEKFNMTADAVAEAAVEAMLSRKAEVVPGFTNLVSAYANRFVPKSFVEKVVGRLYNSKK